MRMEWLILDVITVLLSGILSFAIAFVIIPKLIKKMKESGITGKDVNKKGKPEIPEMGGVAVLFAFTISLCFVVGMGKLIDSIIEPPILAAISVFFVAALIGIIDDVSILSQRFKCVFAAFAALPLMLIHFGTPSISLPFNMVIDFNYHLYWLILVPFGVTGVANAMNMSAGYNGVESGQVVVISFFLLIISVVKGTPEVSLMIFAALMGSALALYYFNRYPSKIFVGDIGSLGMGAVIAAGVIMGNIEFYGIICILPAFYEATATAYYALRREERKNACNHPIILKNGNLKSPKGAEKYTLFYLILSKKPMPERRLVNVVLLLYVVCGVVAVVLSLL
jgi:UDP-N-acetylglucosamine--dolichyl-phosphate N-acetylglucosaminephosphotransferase